MAKVNPDCLHCVLSERLDKFVTEHGGEVSAAHIAFHLGEVLRDVLAHGGIHKAQDADPSVIVPMANAFMTGLGLNMGEAVIVPEGGTRH